MIFPNSIWSIMSQMGQSIVAMESPPHDWRSHPLRSQCSQWVTLRVSHAMRCRSSCDFLETLQWVHSRVHTELSCRKWVRELAFFSYGARLVKFVYTLGSTILNMCLHTTLKYWTYVYTLQYWTYEFPQYLLIYAGQIDYKEVIKIILCTKFWVWSGELIFSPSFQNSNHQCFVFSVWTWKQNQKKIKMQ